MNTGSLWDVFGVALDERQRLKNGMRWRRRRNWEERGGCKKAPLMITKIRCWHM